VRCGDIGARLRHMDELEIAYSGSLSVAFFLGP